MKHLKPILVFLLVATILVFLILINYFHSYIYSNFLVNFPVFSIPIVSILIILVITSIFSSWATENDRLKYEFITVVTHKFRTPITGIKWAIAALRKDITLQEKEDLLRKMEGTNERLMEIVDLLVGSVKFDKKLEYTYEAASLREMIDVSLQKYSEHIRRKDIIFKIDSGQSLPLIIIDKRKIQFAVDMLIDNAIKYTPSDGTITVSLKQEDDHIILGVHDSGIGINAIDIRRIFKRFFRTTEARALDNEGMGLGLYTVKKIIEKHNGKIWVESEGKGKGSNFFIQLKVKS